MTHWRHPRDPGEPCPQLGIVFLVVGMWLLGAGILIMVFS
jgi:hypothetical protein